MVKRDQRILTWNAIFCDFSRFSTRGHPLLTCPKHCACAQEKKVTGMGSVLRGQNRLPTGQNFIRFRYRVDFFSKARFRSVDWPSHPRLPAAARRNNPPDPRRGAGFHAQDHRMTFVCTRQTPSNYTYLSPGLHDSAKGSGNIESPPEMHAWDKSSRPS